MNLTQDFIMAVGTIKFLDKTRSKGYIQAEEIAKKLGFSAGYLHKTLQMLAKYGLVECKRGKTGGTKGRKRKITLLDIWEVTCGQIDTVSPPVPELKKPLKVFADALSKVVVCK